VAFDHRVGGGPIAVGNAVLAAEVEQRRSLAESAAARPGGGHVVHDPVQRGAPTITSLVAVAVDVADAVGAVAEDRVAAVRLEHGVGRGESAAVDAVGSAEEDQRVAFRRDGASSFWKSRPPLITSS
jgi:hypothetical protein